MDFYDTLLTHGLRLKESPQPDGKIHRVATDAKPKRKNGWYKLAYDGTIGWFGDFTSGLSMTWKADEATLAVIPRRDNAELRRKQAEDRRIAGRAIASARKAWHNLSPMRAIHPYLTMKNLTVQGCDAIRIDANARWFRAWYRHKGIELHVRGDLLAVPMYRAGQLMSLQAIDGSGKKLFWKDAPAKGTYLELARANATVTILTEGFATGLCLLQCIPQARVLVCFSADNMVYVADDLNLTGMVVVAADNDHVTAAKLLAETGVATNPGIEKGRKAAEAIGCQAVWPMGIEGSDWLDAKNEWGEGGASEVRNAVLRAVRPVRRVRVPA